MRRAADRARGLWEVLAGSVSPFPTDGGVAVAVAPDSLLCPPGWVGVVELDGSALVTAPDDATAERVRVLTALGPGSRTDVDVVRARLPVADVLGPALLAYLDAASLTTVELRTAPVAPAAGDAHPDLRDVVELDAPGPELRTLLGRVEPDDADESGVAELTSPAFALRRAGAVVAVAGFRAWPGDVAHLSVLTAPEVRGQGYGRLVARAATTAALDAGLLPQWRARVEPSQRIARSLGYRDLGSQLSVRLG
ncbi:GNAT family N-acetyltransferase [Cellulomonas cellasea]|uniref:GNAT superfamily N-acetyltransferase n=1 Tax=Cellulomonas cellasea TaxID=43670 RepID=A0A7W4UDF8_9CELL|nr:GNAT family N-acetyltransferase [Cellulomonas cellasea]MBB2922146.1 GNAT superfamily N-acetyltransferase [Cellulomonas cellasea]